MQRRKKISSLALMICLSFVGCRSIDLPKLEDHERCVVSIEHDVCRCHIYRVSAKKVGRISESVNKPLSHCEKLIGFSPTQWAEYVVWLEEVFETVNDANSKDGKRFKTFPDIEKPEDIKTLIDYFL